MRASVLQCFFFQARALVAIEPACRFDSPGQVARATRQQGPRSYRALRQKTGPARKLTLLFVPELPTNECEKHVRPQQPNHFVRSPFSLTRQLNKHFHIWAGRFAYLAGVVQCYRGLELVASNDELLLSAGDGLDLQVRR